MTFPGIAPITFWQTAAAAPAAGIVTSIQPFEIVIASGATSNTATISTVDNTRTAIFPADFNQDNVIGNIQNSRLRVELTNATTITARRTGNVGNVTARGTAVEFNSTGVESVEYGITTMVSGNLTATTTITSANMSRAAIFNLGSDMTAGSTTTAANFTTAIRLTDPTTITADRDDSLSSVNGDTGWCLVRFSEGVANVQHMLFASTSAGITEQHALLSEVNPARAIIAWGGNRGASSTEQHFYHALELSSSAAVTVSRGEGNTSTHKVHYNVIEFAPAYVNTIQRGTIYVNSSALSNTATITSANTSKSAVAWGGFLTLGDQPNEQDTTAKLSNATTVTAEKGGTSTLGSDDCRVAYEVITFV